MPRPKRSKIVGYRRTSTDDQRLGIEAQDARLRDIAEEKGCEIARLFTEHESGGDNARPELARAWPMPAGSMPTWWWRSWTDSPAMPRS